jgi:hypothetical protein
MEEALSKHFTKTDRTEASIWFQNRVGEISAGNLRRQHCEIVPLGVPDQTQPNTVRVVDLEWFRRVDRGEKVSWQSFVALEGRLDLQRRHRLREGLEREYYGDRPKVE